MLCLLLVLLVGCRGPLDGYDTASLSHQIMLEAKSQLGGDRPVIGERAEYGADEDLGYNRKHLDELNRISGPTHFINLTIDPGETLDGSKNKVAKLTIDQIVEMAVKNNLDVRVARLIPVARETFVTEAEAAFDPVAFANGQFEEIDRPQQASSFVGNPISASQQVRDTADIKAGLRKKLETGATVEASTTMRHFYDKTPNQTFFPNPAWTAEAGFEVTQPLLRNAGVKVNRAQIELAANAHRRDVYAMTQRVSEVVRDVSGAYWELAFAHYSVAVRQDLLAKTQKTLADLLVRQEVDVKPIQIAQAKSFVRERKSDLVQAQMTLRNTSDGLKRLLHDQSLPLLGETIIIPSGKPVRERLTMTLSEAAVTALNSRPDLKQALLDISDTKIQKVIAENLELPMLNLKGEFRYLGLDVDVPDSYDNLGDGDHLEYLVGLEFETPLGNRAAMATAKRARLLQQTQTLRYRNTAQEAILAVKQSMRALQSAYRLMEITRQGRLAAAENMRSLMEREKDAEPLTPEFLLDLKLNTQQRLADAELREMRSVVDYNIAIARFYDAIGKILEESGLDMIEPDVGAEAEAVATSKARLFKASKVAKEANLVVETETEKELKANAKTEQDPGNMGREVQ